MNDRPRLLIVDDDALILAALERQLASDHDVVLCADPVAALRAVREGPAFDVILCDLIMPRMSGVQFHAELARIEPAQAERTILMTGGTFRRDAREMIELAAIPTVTKPFSVELLRRMIDEILVPEETQRPTGTD